MRIIPNDVNPTVLNPYWNTVNGYRKVYDLSETIEIMDDEWDKIWLAFDCAGTYKGKFS